VNEKQGTTRVPSYVSAEELLLGRAEILGSPKEAGDLRMIVARPNPGERRCLERGELSPEGGLIGDRWLATSWLKLPDGSPDPAVQVTLMNARCIELVAGGRDYWPLAGDNLFVDFDLSFENLPTGSQLEIGPCLLEITEPPHTGCAKFKHRYGIAALAFVNSAEGKRHRLRGAHARIVRGGTIATGDQIRRIG
jgi:hypothetical protein